jgi:hypothetical protein
MACREPQGFMKSTKEKKAQDLERYRGKDEKCSVRKHVREFFFLGSERLCTHELRKKPRLPDLCRKVPTAVHTKGTAHPAPEVPELFYA